MKTSRIARIAAVAAVGALGALVPLGVAGAATYPNGGTPEVLPSDQTRPGSGSSSTVAGAEVSPSVAAKDATRPSTLPFTGTDVAELVAIGGASVGVGVVLVRRSRRVRTS